MSAPVTAPGTDLAAPLPRAAGLALDLTGRTALVTGAA
ncbi:3-hydroxybutyrate dehydrogenase, partial [Streptomyces sp. SID2131]|nr:3-hydroxybutyrate dehydrogenase [Streptomyces sp. SID2131]